MLNPNELRPPKTAKSLIPLSDAEIQRRWKIAQERFAVIAPLQNGTFTESSKAEYARRIAKQPLETSEGIRYYSAKTILRWDSIYRADGFEGLMPKTRADNGSFRAIPGEAQQEILDLHAKFPRMSASQIRDHLVSATTLDPTVSLSTVQRFLKAIREEELFQSDDCKDRRAFEAEEPNTLWQCDTAHFPPITIDGMRTKTYLMIILDDNSRLIVGARIFTADNALNFQSLFKTAVQTYGIPVKLLTDNGGPYANEQLGKICASIGTVLIHAKPYDPQTKGKCERVIRTCRDQFLAALDPDDVTDLEDFNRRLLDWVRHYNNTVHSVTKMTPKERFRFLPDTSIRRPRSQEWLDMSFLNRAVRKVKNDSTLQINSTVFDAPMQFQGQKVEVLYAPDDPEEVYIFFGGEYIPIRPTDRIANGKAKRISHDEPTVNWALEVPDSHAD